MHCYTQPMKYLRAYCSFRIFRECVYTVIGSCALASHLCTHMFTHTYCHFGVYKYIYTSGPSIINVHAMVRFCIRSFAQASGTCQYMQCIVLYNHIGLHQTLLTASSQVKLRSYQLVASHVHSHLRVHAIGISGSMTSRPSFYRNASAGGNTFVQPTPFSGARLPDSSIPCMTMPEPLQHHFKRDSGGGDDLALFGMVGLVVGYPSLRRPLVAASRVTPFIAGDVGYKTSFLMQKHGMRLRAIVTRRFRLHSTVPDPRKIYAPAEFTMYNRDFGRGAQAYSTITPAPNRPELSNASMLFINTCLTLF
jgi:hypothetical protein